MITRGSAPRLLLTQPGVDHDAVPRSCAGWELGRRRGGEAERRARGQKRRRAARIAMLSGVRAVRIGWMPQPLGHGREGDCISAAYRTATPLQPACLLHPSIHPSLHPTAGATLTLLDLALCSHPSRALHLSTGRPHDGARAEW